MVLFQVHDAADNEDVVFRSQVADSVMVILPGIFSGLLEVATGSDIQGHKLTVARLNLILNQIYNLNFANESVTLILFLFNFNLFLNCNFPFF